MNNAERTRFNVHYCKATFSYTLIDSGDPFTWAEIEVNKQYILGYHREGLSTVITLITYGFWCFERFLSPNYGAKSF